VIAAELFRAGVIAGYDRVQDSNVLTQNALGHLRIVAQYSPISEFSESSLIPGPEEASELAEPAGGKRHRRGLIRPGSGASWTVIRRRRAFGICRAAWYGSTSEIWGVIM
jgi:hypothetical protein